MLQSLMQVNTNRDGVVNRRSFLRSLAVGAAGVGMLGWKDMLTVHADEMRKEGMSCVLVFLRGGASQLETFDPKPGTTNGGPTKGIDTALTGIKFADPWTKIAKAMKDFTLIRSMTNGEGQHNRATYQMHTGYVPSGSVNYPTIGSIVSNEIGPKHFDLPHYVHIGGRFETANSGFLGMSVAPFDVPDPAKLPANIALPNGVDAERLNRRLDFMKELEKDFAAAGGKPRVKEHGDVYDNASKMILSPRLKAFDISQEKDAVLERYGRTSFGKSCLLARRLVEQGVTFVEIESGGWDAHLGNFEKHKQYAGSHDPAITALIADLKERGRLDKTLFICMGEFGRTPKINKFGGRDHYPRVSSVLLAGGGLKAGTVIGSTTDDGASVKDRPVKVNELFSTFYKALKINPQKENMSSVGRPIKILDGGEPINELF